ncbi:MAG: diacylglycerol kinase family protein [Pseudomonadota bacterium]
MTVAGVIRNPRSQRNKARPLRENALPDGVVLEMPFTTAALAETLQRFAAEGIRHLMVDGGDGTLRDVMSQLPAAYGSDWPSIALCASGNTNLAAADVGSFTRDEHAIARWHDTLTGKAPARISSRQPIEVRWPDGSQAPVFGFFVGCANYARAVAMATGGLREKGLFHGWAVSATIAGAAWQVLAGGKNNDWQRGSAVGVRIDDIAPVNTPRFVLLATSLDRLLLGLWPFWSAPGAPGALHWLDIDAPAPKFGRALPTLLRGKPRPWALATGAYRSGRAARITLTLAEPLIIDGEPFAPDASGQLSLQAGPEVQFYAPA